MHQKKHSSLYEGNHQELADLHEAKPQWRQPAVGQVQQKKGRTTKTKFSYTGKIQAQQRSLGSSGTYG